MAWQFLITDLQGLLHGEVNAADDRKVGLPHLRIPTASFNLPLESPLADVVMDTDTLLRAYRYDEPSNTKALVFDGPVVSAEEASDGTKQGIAVVAAGPFWRVTKRFIGKTTGGYSQGIPTPIDLGLAAHNIIDATNGAGFTGIGKGSRAAVTTGGFGPWWLKNAAEAIAELSGGINSFEHVVDPIEPQSEPGGVGGWPRIGNMRIAPAIGQLKPDAVFEYGTDRANVSTYSRSVSREGMMTQGIISVNGWPDTPPPGSGLIIQADSVATRGLFEDVVPDAGVVNNTLRSSIVAFHLKYRKVPKEVLTFQPAVNARPAPIVDYMPGDTVRARALVNGKARFDDWFRIWGVTFNIDQTGNENVELELIRP
jgi:hypothetical protein